MKPNIILIITDDQTLNTIGSKNNCDIDTPNLDALCTSGTFFNNCHIHGGTSGAICMPSRAILHSSQNMFKLKDAGNQIPEEHPLLGEELRKNGYNTFFTGKWHNGTKGFTRSFSHGDNIFFGGMWDHYNVPMNCYDPEGKYDNYVNYVVNFFNTNQTHQMQANKFNPGIHSTDVITNTALDFLESYEQNQPFFLNVAYLAPHDPRVMPRKYQDLYENREISLPANFASKHQFLFGQQFERDEQIAPSSLSHEWYLSELKAYYAMITHLDAQIGRLINKLKQLNLYDEALIIFTSDNGLAIGAHGLMGKQNLYEESIRVPLILKSPNHPSPASEVKELVTLQDIMPTILDFANIKIPTNIDGLSFKRCLQKEEPIHSHLYFAFTHYIRAIKYQNYKLIKYRPREGEEINQLFNLNDDRLELTNLYYNPKYQQIKKQLELKLLDESLKIENEDNPFTTKYWGKYE